MIQKDSYNYGLKPTTGDNDDRRSYGTLYAELDSFLSYMTVASDPPICEQTARVCMSHARLFLGWIVDVRGCW